MIQTKKGKKSDLSSTGWLVNYRIQPKTQDTSAPRSFFLVTLKRKSKSRCTKQCIFNYLTTHFNCFNCFLTGGAQKQTCIDADQTRRPFLLLAAACHIWPAAAIFFHCILWFSEIIRWRAHDVTDVAAKKSLEDSSVLFSLRLTDMKSNRYVRPSRTKRWSHCKSFDEFDFIKKIKK